MNIINLKQKYIGHLKTYLEYIKSPNLVYTVGDIKNPFLQTRCTIKIDLVEIEKFFSFLISFFKTRHKDFDIEIYAIKNISDNLSENLESIQLSMLNLDNDFCLKNMEDSNRKELIKFFEDAISNLFLLDIVLSRYEFLIKDNHSI